LRIADHRARQREPLLLSSAQLPDARTALLAELHEVDHLVHAPAARIEAAEQPHGLLHRELVGELRLLELDAEPLAQRVLVVGPASPEHFHHALVRRRQPLADLDRRRLARAIRSEETEA